MKLPPGKDWTKIIVTASRGPAGVAALALLVAAALTFSLFVNASGTDKLMAMGMTIVFLLLVVVVIALAAIKRTGASDEPATREDAAPLIGYWTGFIDYDLPAGTPPFSLPVNVQFVFKDGALSGSADCAITYNGKERRLKIRMIHFSVPYQGFYHMTYHNEDLSVKQMGNVFVELCAGNEELVGYQIGFGVFTQRPFSAKVRFTKHLAGIPKPPEAVPLPVELISINGR